MSSSSSLSSSSSSSSSSSDSHVRSLLKGLSWRVIATATTVTIAWFVSGSAEQALRIGSIEFVGKVAIYYAHERVWTWLPR